MHSGPAFSLVSPLLSQECVILSQNVIRIGHGAADGRGEGSALDDGHVLLGRWMIVLSCSLTDVLFVLVSARSPFIIMAHKKDV